VKDDRPAKLQGLVEVDAMFLLESQIGAKNLTRTPRQRGDMAGKRGISAELVNMVVARDRSGQTIDFIAGRGALTADALHAGLLAKLQSNVNYRGCSGQPPWVVSQTVKTSRERRWGTLADEL
jgi:hypothetical protein